MLDTMEVLASGLSAARMRVNVLASNIANAETTRTAEGGPYRRKDIVQVAQPISGTFGAALDEMSLARPQVEAVIEDQSDPRMVFQPGHPDADPNGYVAYPNISVVTTMTDLMSATRLYQANVSALDSAKQMIAAANQISLRG